MWHTGKPHPQPRTTHSHTSAWAHSNRRQRHCNYFEINFNKSSAPPTLSLPLSLSLCIYVAIYLSPSCTVTLSLSVSNFVVCLGKCLTACWLSLLYGSTNSHQSCREFLLLHALRSFPSLPPLSVSSPLSLCGCVLVKNTLLTSLGVASCRIVASSLSMNCN